MQTKVKMFYVNYKIINKQFQLKQTVNYKPIKNCVSRTKKIILRIGLTVRQITIWWLQLHRQ